MSAILDSNRFSIHSNSKGNLLKSEYEKNGILYFVKTGRIQLREFPGKWGIEPIVEVICSMLGARLGLNIAKQELKVLTGKRYDKELTTFVSSSPDFRNGKSIVYLQTLYIQDSKYIDLEWLCRKMDGVQLINLLAFDLIIMNEDRHNGNVAWLVSDNGEIELAPIFDNGYALLYDDINGMLKDFKAAASFCPCNAPLYNDSFAAAEQLFRKLSKIYRPTINLDLSNENVRSVIKTAKWYYNILTEEESVNNVEIPNEWWDCAEQFINWRLDYVRALRYNLER